MESDGTEIGELHSTIEWLELMGNDKINGVCLDEETQEYWERRLLHCNQTISWRETPFLEY